MNVALELQPVCGKRSGIGTYAYELVRRLNESDEMSFYGDVFNFCGRNDNTEVLRGIGFPVRVWRAFPYGVYRRIWHFAPVPYSWLFPPADLTVFFNYIVPPKVKGRVATTIYDLTYLRFPETMERKNLLRIRQDIGYSVERSDRIFTISSFIKREIMDCLSIPGERITVIPCAPAVQAAPVPFAELQKKWGIRRPYLLYVGTIEPRKNLARLIQAYARLREEAGIPHQLVLAGGAGWGNAEIYQMAERSRASADILFTGFVSGAEKTALYQNAEAFLFPSLYEGFGIPPLEAMESGCPVVCANAASLPEVVGDAAELVDPLDTVSIAEGIFRVLSDPDRADMLRGRGGAQFKKYSWEASARQLESACGEILKGV